MKLVLTVGLPAVPFGTSYDAVVERIGSPISEQLLADLANYPNSRRILTDEDYDLAIAPEFGVFAVLVDAEATQVEVFDVTINSLSLEDFVALLQANGCEAEITNPDGFGDQDVHAADNGIIASYSESQLTSFEIHDPGCCAAARNYQITTGRTGLADAGESEWAAQRSHKVAQQHACQHQMNADGTQSSHRQARHTLTSWTIICGGIVALVFFVCVLAFWSGYDRRAGIAYFEERGGQVTTKPLSPRWLNDILPTAVAHSVAGIEAVSLQDTGVNDLEIDNLSRLARLEFQTLERLNLENTQVTDASLQDLHALTNLKRLVLENTKVTDSGLVYVAELTSLEGLNLEQTQITDAGLHQLQALTLLRGLSLCKTEVSDAGLPHLWIHTSLTGLDLRKTNVTEGGVVELRLRLPNCEVLY